MKYTPITSDKKMLYTKGKEYMLLSGTEYIGYYYEKNNFLFSTDDKRLLKLNTNNIFLKFLKLKGQYIYTRFEEPIAILKINPTERDYTNGFIKRFFIKKRNDYNSVVIEIDNKQYDTLTDKRKGINGNLYYGITLEWKITGKIYDVKKNDIITENGIYDTNKRTIQHYEKKMKGLQKLLSGRYIEYSLNN